MRWLKFLSQERVYVRQPSRHYRFCRCYRCLNATRGGGHGRRSAYKPKPDGHGAGRHPGMSIIATTIGASALADQFHPPPVPPPPTSKSKTVPPPPPAPAPFSIVSTVNQFGINCMCQEPPEPGEPKCPFGINKRAMDDRSALEAHMLHFNGSHLLRIYTRIPTFQLQWHPAFQRPFRSKPCPCCQQPLAFWPTRWPAHSFTETWTAAEVYDSLMNQWLAHMATHEGSGHVTVNLEWFKLWEPSSRRPDRLTPTQEKRLIDGRLVHGCCNALKKESELDKNHNPTPQSIVNHWNLHHANYNIGENSNVDLPYRILPGTPLWQYRTQTFVLSDWNKLDPFGMNSVLPHNTVPKPRIYAMPPVANSHSRRLHPPILRTSRHSNNHSRRARDRETRHLSSGRREADAPASSSSSSSSSTSYYPSDVDWASSRANSSSSSNYVNSRDVNRARSGHR